MSENETPAKTPGVNTLEKPLGYAEITKVLPHRYPFLLIDRVTELVPGERVKGYKNITANEPFFNGHFPGLPVMPGVLQIEALAQAAAVLASSLHFFNPGTHVAYLMSIDEVKFRRLVVPGDRLDLEIEVLHLKKTVVKVKGRASVDGERACEATIMAAIRERPT